MNIKSDFYKGMIHELRARFDSRNVSRGFLSSDAMLTVYLIYLPLHSIYVPIQPVRVSYSARVAIQDF